jgi:hypothetical protein
MTGNRVLSKVKSRLGCPGKHFLYQVQGMMTEFALDVGDLQDVN